jgi:hypothetical protein
MLGYSGYGYQIWMEKNNGFAFRGMGSQLAFCYPDKDLLFACISDTQGAGATGSGITDVFYEEIFNKISDSPLAENTDGNERLATKIKELHILPQHGSTASSIEKSINGRWYILNENPMHITKMRLHINGAQGLWEYQNESGFHQLEFGIGKNVSGAFPQNNYFGDRIGEIPGVCYNCLSSAAWVEDHKLDMLIYITDIYLGTLKITFSLKGNEIGIYMTKVAEWFLDEYMGFAGGCLE